jgi:hypothetical protein
VTTTGTHILRALEKVEIRKKIPYDTSKGYSISNDGNN